MVRKPDIFVSVQEMSGTRGRMILRYLESGVTRRVTVGGEEGTAALVLADQRNGLVVL